MAKSLENATAKFVDDLGGPAKVAETLETVVGLKTTAGAVRNWAHRNAVPRPVWPELIKAYPHLTIDKLLAIESADRAA